MANWRLDASCWGSDIELFYSKGTHKQAALRLCRICPVREACLEDALVNHDDFGIRGGTTAKERRAILRFRRQLNGVVVTNPRANKKIRRSGFSIS